MSPPEDLPIDLPIFPSNKIRLVCISDTHNDNPSAKMPPGDIFVHAGDMVNKGTLQELTAAYDWIAALPHKIKIIVAGNNDRGLQPGHSRYSASAHTLFTSSAAKAQGIHYLTHQVRTVAYCTTKDGKHNPITIYGNPAQPNFQYETWRGTQGQAAFDYPPHPSQESFQAWAEAPKAGDDVPIWVMHGAPRGRLDVATVEGLRGCPVQWERIAKARPGVCVFGHFHYSYGVERVQWGDDEGEVVGVDEVVIGEERRGLVGEGGEVEVEVSGRGRETLFVNASWMRSDKGREERNPVVVVSLSMGR